MNRYRLTLPALLLAAIAGLAGCGKDAPEPPEPNVGGAVGKQYNDMLDQARQGADAANRQMQDTQRRIDEQR